MTPLAFPRRPYFGNLRKSDMDLIHDQGRILVGEISQYLLNLRQDT